MTALALERRFRQEARRSGVPRDVVEKDFALSYALAGIFGVEQLASTLVFKGGTALRKGYFADYRYSEDAEHFAREAGAPPKQARAPHPYRPFGRIRLHPWYEAAGAGSTWTSRRRHTTASPVSSSSR
jgi:hypothetical protein